MFKNSINQASLATDQNSRNGRTINAVPTGGPDDAVLRFDVVSAVVGNSSIAVVTTAANGTVATISEAGAYQIDLSLDWTGAVAIAAGIGINMTIFTVDPALGVDGVIKATDVLGVAAFTGHIELSTTVYVTGAQAAAGLTVRFLATNSAGAAPAGLVVAFGGWRISQIAQVSF